MTMDIIHLHKIVSKYIKTPETRAKIFVLVQLTAGRNKSVRYLPQEHYPHHLAASAKTVRVHFNTLQLSFIQLKTGEPQTSKFVVNITHRA